SIIIFKKLKKRSKIIEKEILGQVAYNNIIKIKQAFLKGKYLRISIKYYRFILKEIIHIYIRLEKAQL
ncbi:hypothetical protein V2W45_1235334, partial [Cenococcum geophilum]